jgi:hypothetical protein
MKSKYVIFLLVPVFLSCQNSANENPESDPKAQEIVDQLIEAYGGSNYDQSKIEFEFRDKSYGSLRRGGNYIYARIFTEDNDLYHDLLSNEGFTREIDGNPADISEKKKAAYTRSVNSVIYFALLPYGLNDPAVIKQYLGEKEIEGKSYHKVLVTFQKDGGGEDHEDEFVYWIGNDDYSMDYFAYAYHTDGGGTRFRKAYNKRSIGGITFQDYINYEGSTSFDHVDDLDEKYIKGELKELSRIELNNIYASQITEEQFHPDSLK